MSITPVLESSDIEMIKYEKSDVFPNKQKLQGFSRQGSYCNSSSQQQRDQIDQKNSSSQEVSSKKFILKEKSSITKIVQNIYFQFFITFLTIITLFLYDIKTIASNKQEDFYYGIVNCICFVIFMAEIIMNCKTEGYLGSFFFFLDLLSTITILFDVDFIIDSLFNQSSNNFKVSSFVAKSKASRVAARAVRVVKIFRLARVAKLYKSAQKAKELSQKNKLAILQKQNERLNNNINNQKQNSAYVNDQMSVYHLISKSHITRKNLNNTSSNLQRYQIQNDSIKQQKEDSAQNNQIRLNQRQRTTKKMSKKSSNSYNHQDQQQQNKQSQISRILSEDTIKKIIIIIILIMTSIPLLDINNYQNVSTQWDMFTNFIGRSLLNKDISTSMIQTLINKQIIAFGETDTYSSVICYDSPFNELSSCTDVNFDSYRSADLGIFVASVNTNQISQIRPDLTLQSALSSKNTVDSFSIFIDYGEYNQIDAGFSIATTTFICLTIIYLLSSFSKSINELIIVPIEYMLNLIRAKDFKTQENAQQLDSKQQQYETELVQNAIIKIKSLMETIYGPLGNELVQEKMMNNNSISQNLNNSLKKSFCVVGLCRINQMCKITEVLGEQAFGLINQVALIVQNAAFRYGGYCTKICDQGFMIVFKVPDQNLKHYQIEEDIDPIFMAKNYQKKLAQAYINTFSDFSVYFALKTLARIAKQPKIFKYRNDQRLLMSFGGLFNIELNFALNMGWCYQTVIGSSHKIDSLVLGEEVNLLDKMMKISRNYSTSILITQSLYSNLSIGLKQHCRPFESIKFSQSEEQKKLYYVDYDICNVTPSVNKNQKAKKDVRDLKTKKQMNMLYLSGLLPQQQGYNSTNFIDSKKELRQILKKSSMEGILRKKYRLAFEKYINGDWSQCQELFETQYLKNDIPSQRLLNFIVKNGYRSPPDWNGYRNYHSLFDINS